jgi:hypothetical protein
MLPAALPAAGVVLYTKEKKRKKEKKMPAPLPAVGVVL